MSAEVSVIRRDESPSVSVDVSADATKRMESFEYILSVIHIFLFYFLF
jgi:hypothetical protein